jgi:hypothetical protein
MDGQELGLDSGAWCRGWGRLWKKTDIPFGIEESSRTPSFAAVVPTWPGRHVELCHLAVERLNQPRPIGP